MPPARLVLPLLLLLLLPAAAPAEQTSVAVVGRLQATYEATSDLRAAFRQVYTFKVNGMKRTSTGRVFLKKPGRMRWDYLSPNARHFISDGATVWLYTPDDAQVFVQPLEDSDLTAAVRFLLGEGNLDAAFTHSLLPADAAGALRLELIPKGGTGLYRKVVLSLDPKSYRVVASEVTDPVGNVNRLEFSDLEANLGLPDEGFVFVPPAGTRVVRASSGGSPE